MTPSPRSGAAYAFRRGVPKVIYTTEGTKRGFINAMLAPVHCAQEPKFGVRQALWFATLTFVAGALLRLLLAQ